MPADCPCTKPSAPRHDSLCAPFRGPAPHLGPVSLPSKAPALLSSWTFSSQRLSGLNPDYFLLPLASRSHVTPAAAGSVRALRGPLWDRCEGRVSSACGRSPRRVALLEEPGDQRGGRSHVLVLKVGHVTERLRCGDSLVFEECSLMEEIEIARRVRHVGHISKKR